MVIGANWSTLYPLTWCTFTLKVNWLYLLMYPSVCSHVSGLSRFLVWLVSHSHSAFCSLPHSGCEYQGEWFNKNNCAVSILRSGRSTSCILHVLLPTILCILTIVSMHLLSTFPQLYIYHICSIDQTSLSITRRYRTVAAPPIVLDEKVATLEYKPCLIIRIAPACACIYLVHHQATPTHKKN